MLKRSLYLLVLSVFALVGPARAADFGTPEQAKAMLEKAVAELQKDKAAALEMFTKGEGGFKDRDLYPTAAVPTGCSRPTPSW